jgi:hypothetical protein
MAMWSVSAAVWSLSVHACNVQASAPPDEQRQALASAVSAMKSMNALGSHLVM